MRISVVFVAAMLTSRAVLAQFAPQVWTAPQDGANNACYDVAYFQANSLAGIGNRCLEADATGQVVVAGSGVACGAGGGGVSSATGTAQRISVSPTTGAVVVDTIGGYSTGAVSGGNVSLGSFASGVDEQVTTAGVAAPFTYQCIATEVQFGAASGGGLAQSSQLTYDGTTLTSNTSSTTLAAMVAENANTAQANPTLTVASSSATGQAVILFDTSGTTSRASFRADYLGDLVFAGVTPATSNIFFFTNGDFGVGSEVMKIFNNGHVQVNTPGVGVDMSDVGHLFSVVGGNIYQSGGRFIEQVQGAPGTPGAGFGIIYVDSTSKNVAIKNDAGTVNHGAQTQTAAAGKAFTALNDAGAFTETSFQAPISITATQVVYGTGSGISSDASFTHDSSTLSTAIGSVAALSTSATDGFLYMPSMAGVPSGTPTHVRSTIATVIDTTDARLYVPNGATPVPLGQYDNFTGPVCSTVTSGVHAVCGAGSITCGMLPALGGDLSSSAGLCSVNVVAVHETSGPTRLDVGAIPDPGSGFASVLNRPGGGATIVGTDSRALSVAEEMTYYVSYTLGVSGTWFATSSSAALGLGTAVSYPSNRVVKNATLCIDLIANGIATGSPVFVVTRNGSSIGGGLAINYSAGDPLGTTCTTSLSTGSASATDNYGFEQTNSSTGTITLSARILLQ